MLRAAPRPTAGLPRRAETTTLAQAAGGGDRSALAVSVVLPCLNEEAAVAGVVAAARRGVALAGIPVAAAEILVVDNGSLDAGPARAAAAGARVLHEARPGYGAAIAAGIGAAHGEVVVFADADGSYDLDRLGELLAPLAAGADLVIGARLRGAIAPGAMPPLHRYLGTPLLGRLLALAGGASVGDSQSGFRAARRQTLRDLDLRAPGMEYASEMLLRAGQAGLKVVEVPTAYRPRLGASKLRPLRDGWRHLRLLLFATPRLTLVAPGVGAVLLGFLLCALSLLAPRGVPLPFGGGLRWLPVFVGPMLLMLGAQSVLLGRLADRRRYGTDCPSAPDRLVAGYGAVALGGVLIDLALLLLWLIERTGPALLGVAGFAQALIVIGLGGIATLFAWAD